MNSILNQQITLFGSGPTNYKSGGSYLPRQNRKLYERICLGLSVKVAEHDQQPPGMRRDARSPLAGVVSSPDTL